MFDMLVSYEILQAYGLHKQALALLFITMTASLFIFFMVLSGTSSSETELIAISWAVKIFSELVLC